MKIPRTTFLYALVAFMIAFTCINRGAGCTVRFDCETTCKRINFFWIRGTPGGIAGLEYPVPRGTDTAPHAPPSVGGVLSGDLALAVTCKSYAQMCIVCYWPSGAGNPSHREGENPLDLLETVTTTHRTCQDNSA